MLFRPDDLCHPSCIAELSKDCISVVCVIIGAVVRLQRRSEHITKVEGVHGLLKQVIQGARRRDCVGDQSRP